MGDRACQVNMRHALAADLGLGHFHATLLTHHTAVLETLVLTAETLVVLYGTKDLGAEQTVAFRFERTVVNGLRLLNFAKGP